LEFIRVWAMQVAGAVVFGILCEMLAPEGKLKGIVRIVLGLIVVVAVINPFMGIADRDLLLGELTFIDNLAVENEQTTFETRATLINAYIGRLQSEIIPKLEPIADGFDVDVRLEVNTDGEFGDDEFGAITDILVILTPNDDNDYDNFDQTVADISAILRNEFDVSVENIRIWRQNQ